MSTSSVGFRRYFRYPVTLSPGGHYPECSRAAFQDPDAGAVRRRLQEDFIHEAGRPSVERFFEYFDLEVRHWDGKYWMHPSRAMAVVYGVGFIITVSIFTILQLAKLHPRMMDTPN